MTILRTLSPPAGVGDKLTSAQLNALDKRLGQTDILGSVITCSASSPARIIPSKINAANADTTYALSQGINVVYISGLSALRNYTFSNTGAVLGDRISFVWAPGTSFPAVVKNAAGTILFQLG